MKESKENLLFPECNLTCALKNNSFMAGSRPDWLLYTIPSIAFVLGVLLFSVVYRTQHRTEKALRRVAALKTAINAASTGHTYTRYPRQGATGPEKKDLSKLQNSSVSLGNLTKNEAQSYENVTTIIYNNEDNVKYRVIQDEDYVTPDTVADEVKGMDTTTYLQPLHNFTDTDGESYENMEGCVYAHPRQTTRKNALSFEDDVSADYINPDEKYMEQTDTESYENMDGSVCPSTERNTNTHTVDEGGYECMDRRQRGERHT